jgi:hypothetical protein
MNLAIQLSGIAAISGALVYALGDILMLAAKANLADYPRLQPYAKTLSGAENMVALSRRRLIWGGLLGVFATPLVLVGFWLLYNGLSPAGLGQALPPVLLFAFASVIGAFVHGSFIYLGEYVLALNRVGEDSQPILMEMFSRHRKIMMITYGFLLVCILVGSIWYSVVVLSGKTLLAPWMAAVNPVTAFLAWLALKKVLPQRVSQVFEGAGFNIAYIVFFVFLTIMLW